MKDRQLGSQICQILASRMKVLRDLRLSCRGSESVVREKKLSHKNFREVFKRLTIFSWEIDLIPLLLIVYWTIPYVRSIQHISLEGRSEIRSGLVPPRKEMRERKSFTLFVAALTCSATSRNNGTYRSGLNP